jgi:hypothetical protein
MRIDVKILNEIRRYKDINNYINEQDVPPPPPGGDVPPPPGGALPPPPPPPGDVPPPPGGAPPPPGGEGAPLPPAEPINVGEDPEVEKIEDETKEKKIKVTDLVKGQKSVEEKQETYFENLFQHLDDLESKLANMDQIIDKLNSIETKIEKYRVKTPEEKMELRSLDSGPYNQKLSQFFQEKEGDFEDMGREQYIIRPDDVQNYSQPDIKKSFREFEDIQDPDKFNLSGYQKLY